jgi:primosomal protein N' (replication factor Y)
MALLADVLLPLPLKQIFTYRIPDEMAGLAMPGSRVAVHFGRQRIQTGILSRLYAPGEKAGNYKDILEVLDDHPVVHPLQLRFWEWMAEYYMCTPGEVLAAALPSAFRLESETAVALHPDFDGDLNPFTEAARRILQALMNRDQISLKEVAIIAAQAKIVNLIHTLLEAGAIIKVDEVKDPYRPRKESVIALHPDYHSEAALSELMDQLGKRAFRQLELMLLLVTELHLPQGEWNAFLPSASFKKVKGYAVALKGLLDKGVLIREERVVTRLYRPEAVRDPGEIRLNAFQQQAYGEIGQWHSQNKICLLHGVTGSGKTEIYIKKIAECLAEGKQALYLLPEIALTTQIINRLRTYFGDKVGVYHSRYSNQERVEVWNEVLRFGNKQMQGRFQLILGARSALFLPFVRLGLIVVDEEHDPSYKQVDPAPRYHARDAALYLARLHAAPVLMGSATPSIESFALAREKKYGLVSLTKRFSEVLMPEVQIADVKEEKRRKKMPSHFSSLLLENLSLALENGEQAIMFQNRRGFSLRLECDSCMWMPYCQNCDVTLIYHKQFHQLRCHYCGYTEKVPSSCPECNSPRILMKGFGTEKVEEELRDLYPRSRIVRMDLDTTRSKTAYHRIISEFERNEIQILVGTQMVTKGLDFDHVSLVGILNADNMLSFPDFRAAERSFQLMAQVSGRSGRKQKRGKVIIQTAQPYHSIIRQVIDHNYVKMYEDQMAERREFSYPPFTRLIQIRIKHKDKDRVADASAWLADWLRGWLGKRILGPEYPLVARIRNEYIKHILIKIEREASHKEARRIIRNALDAIALKDEWKRVKVQVDVDPY